MHELKSRGVSDVLVAVVDGLKGFPDAIEAVFPDATVQTCLVHLIRRSLAYASYKERRSSAEALKTLYRAPPAAAAEAALDAFEAGAWGEKHPAIASWRCAWEQGVPFFAFSQPIRRAIYTTNAIESLNSTLRRAVRTRGHFPNDWAAPKLLTFQGSNLGYIAFDYVFVECHDILPSEATTYLRTVFDRLTYFTSDALTRDHLPGLDEQSRDRGGPTQTG